MSEQIAGEAEVRTRHPYNGWTVLDKLSVESAREAAHEAAEQLGWKDRELQQLRSVSDIVGELLWRREEARFTRRKVKRLEAENERLREALRPFAEHGEAMEGCCASDEWDRVTTPDGEWEHWLAVEHFFTAAETLTDSEEASRE